MTSKKVRDEKVKNNTSSNKVVNFISSHPSPEGEKALTDKMQITLYTALIVVFVILPIMIFSMLNIIKHENVELPEGATKHLKAAVSLSEDTFWYTKNNKKYEYDLKDYGNVEDYQRGDYITVYVDKNYNVIAIDNYKVGNTKLLYMLIMFASPIVILLIHALLCKYWYCRWWYIYCKWFDLEIDPILDHKDFEKLVERKQFYEPKVRNILPNEAYKKYSMYNILEIVMSVLAFAIPVSLTFYLLNKGISKSLAYGIMFVIIVFFVIIINMLVDEKRSLLLIKHRSYVNKKKKK